MSCCTGNTVSSHALDVEQGKLSADLEEQRIWLASHRQGDGLVQTDFLVPSMHCIACIRTLENGIGSMQGVSQARANLSTRRVSVLWDVDKVRGLDILSRFTALGFKATLFDLEGDADQKDTEGTRLLIATGVAGFAAANIMLMSISVWSGADAETTQLFHLISGLIAIPAVMYSGQHFFRSAWQALRSGRLNMDVPISLAVLMALGMSIYESLAGGKEAYFDASVTLLFFLLVGRYLDHSMREKARGAINRLTRLAAKGAAVISENGESSFLPLSEIGVGAHIGVAAGERIPLDGIVIKGQSDIDRSLVTGESEPVVVRPGDELEAGTLNLSAPIQMSVTHTADKSFIGEVMQMMEAAEQGKAKYVRIADRLAAIYAPAVHLLALLAFIAWMVTTGDWQVSLYVAIAVLIITCPCALGLAVPIVHVVGAGRMFEAGIMVKDGAALERLSEVDSFVFDKTGTLTLGEPMITGLYGDNNLEGLAVAMASHSRHPMARAVTESRQADHRNFDLTDIREVPGCGLEANLGVTKIRFGHPRWAAEITAHGVEDKFDEKCGLDDLAVALGVEGRAILGFSAMDCLRPGVHETLAKLIGMGYPVEILSGDRHSKVEELARELGVTVYHGEMKPQDKVRRLEELAQQGKKTCMVGDGINDAPALSAAHVSIAPSSGSDVGAMASDLVFTAENLDCVLFGLEMAKATNRLVRQNFAIAILYNCIAIPLAFMGHVTPLFAAIAMSASSLAVISNSLRLKLIGWKGFRLKRPDLGIKQGGGKMESAR